MTTTDAVPSGADVRAWRLALGWSQERLAQAVGVSVVTVCRWETGKHPPSPLAIRGLRAVERRARAVPTA